MSDLGVAVRVHSREEAARIVYRRARYRFLSRQREGLATYKSFHAAHTARARWSCLREIIDAEERRVSKARGPLEERFWRKVEKRDGCWGWRAATDQFGYGVIGRGGRAGGNTTAHRASWEIHNGPIPEGMYVLHACDNPPCSNPEHLFLGSHLDNIADMVAKGRHVGARS